MEFLRAVGRFILAQLAILGFLLLAPAILVGVSLFAITGGAGSNSGFLAFFYMAAGPFARADGWDVAKIRMPMTLWT